MRRKILIAAVVAPVIFVVAGLLYLKFGDLGWMREPIVVTPTPRRPVTRSHAAGPR